MWRNRCSNEPQPRPPPVVVEACNRSGIYAYIPRRWHVLYMNRREYDEMLQRGCTPQQVVSRQRRAYLLDEQNDLDTIVKKPCVAPQDSRTQLLPLIIRGPLTRTPEQLYRINKDIEKEVISSISNHSGIPLSLSDLGLVNVDSHDTRRRTLPKPLRHRRYTAAYDFIGSTFAVGKQAFRYSVIPHKEHDDSVTFVKVRTKVLPRKKHKMPSDALPMFKRNKLLLSPPYSPAAHVGEVKIGKDGYPWISKLTKLPHWAIHIMEDNAYWSRLRVRRKK